jgi:hypothetical protein
MTVTLEDARTLLTSMVRTIDRKADVVVVAQPGGEAGVTATVTLRKHKAVLAIPARDIEAAKQSSMQHAQLRTTVKRAIDRAAFTVTPMASTKTARGPEIDGGFFRGGQQGFRGGRR